MIVPPSIATAPTTSNPLGPGLNDNSAPSETNLLMAAAEMHRQGRLRGKPKPTAAKEPV